MMNNPGDPFDPSLRALFDKQDLIADNSHLKEEGRQLFYNLHHLDDYYGSLPAACNYIYGCLQAATDHYQDQFLTHYSPDQLDFKTEQAQNPLPVTGQNRASINECLLQTTPIILTEPCWLQSISQAATSETEIACSLMTVYQRLVQPRHADPVLTDSYRSLLSESGIKIPELHSYLFSRQPEVLDCMFEFAALQLSLSRYTRHFFPEILGFTLAYCQSPTLAEYFFSIHPLQTLTGAHCFFSIRERIKSQTPDVLKIIKIYFDCHSTQESSLWQRVQSGFRMYQHQFNHCCLELKLQLNKQSSIEFQMANLLRNKAGFAYGHHQNIRLDNKSLDEWFSESPFRPDEFMKALVNSPLINKRQPNRSPILKLFEFDGPMFGVLDPAEHSTLNRWIQSLNEENQDADKFRLKYSENKPSDSFTDHLIAEPVNYSIITNRELFYYLVNADLFPSIFPAAKKKVSDTLRRTAFFNRPPFKTYDHQIFHDYVHSLYQQEIRAYEPLKGTPGLSRQTFIWGIEQLAPAILIDGCWLQDVTRLNPDISNGIKDILFQIFCDEAGDGVRRQNHPHIYIKLLQNLDVKIPPVHSPAFNRHKEFLDSAFDLPVYLLAISRFPGTFMPELLGLNLAIELSGLGRVYLRLSEELKYWNIDSTIVDIHISIDNFASGHSALAIKAIQLYLDDIAARFGRTEMQRHWHRIAVGYHSLKSSSRRFQLALVSRYLLRQAKTRATGKFFN